MLIAGGCSEDFLDEKPSEQLSPEQITEASKDDPSVLDGFTNGMYYLMFKMETGGTTNHDDFGQKGYDIYSDMLASDLALAVSVYGWYSDLVRYQPTTNYTLNAAYQPWRYYYRVVFAANSLIDLLGGNDADLEEESQIYAMGQAKAMRAYAYFYLTQFYAVGYGDGSEPILPLYLDTTTPSQPLSTAQEVYSQIVNDLTEAITLLEGFQRDAKTAINQDVAKGLLAYALAARGTDDDLEQVIDLTNEVIEGGSYELLGKDEVVAELDEDGNLLNRGKAGFNDVASPSWMWGADLNLDINLDLVSWWGQMDLFTYSYQWAGDAKVIDNGLYASIREDDIRKRQFDPDYALRPVNKFFDPDRVIGGQRTVVTDYVYMRLEEMVLLNAEANARLENDDEAIEALKKLLELRIEDYSYVDALSGQDLLDEIYLQTRIELWGEGKTYLAVKRLEKTVTRGSNHRYLPGESFSWDSDELTFPIPQAELLNNPAIEAN